MITVQELYSLSTEEIFVLIREGQLSEDLFEDWIHDRIESVVDTYSEGF